MKKQENIWTMTIVSIMQLSHCSNQLQRHMPACICWKVCRILTKVNYAMIYAIDYSS